MAGLVHTTAVSPPARAGNCHRLVGQCHRTLAIKYSPVRLAGWKVSRTSWPTSRLPLAHGRKRPNLRDPGAAVGVTAVVSGRPLPSRVLRARAAPACSPHGRTGTPWGATTASSSVCVTGIEHAHCLEQGHPPQHRTTVPNTDAAERPARARTACRSRRISDQVGGARWGQVLRASVSLRCTDAPRRRGCGLGPGRRSRSPWPMHESPWGRAWSGRNETTTASSCAGYDGSVAHPRTPHGRRPSTSPALSKVTPGSSSTARASRQSPFHPSRTVSAPSEPSRSSTNTSTVAFAIACLSISTGDAIGHDWLQTMPTSSGARRSGCTRSRSATTERRAERQRQPSHRQLARSAWTCVGLTLGGPGGASRSHRLEALAALWSGPPATTTRRLLPILHSHRDHARAVLTGAVRRRADDVARVPSPPTAAIPARPTPWICASSPRGAGSTTVSCSTSAASTSNVSPATSKIAASAHATVARRLCTIVGFYRYAEEEGVIEHSLPGGAHPPAAHRLRVRRLPPRPQGARRHLGRRRHVFARDHALVSLLALNGLRVSEAIGANIEALGQERGHRTLTVLRKGGKVVTMPLAPRVARAIDVAVG